MNEDQLKTCIDAAKLLWKLGMHHPQDALIAYNFTKIVEELMKAAESKE